MRFNDFGYRKGDGFNLILFILGSTIFLIVLFVPVNQWWIFGPDNVPLMLEDATLAVAIWLYYPGIVILALIFLIGLSFWRISKEAF